MKKTTNFIFVISILFFFSGCAKTKSFKDLEQEKGFYYLKGKTKLYTGKILEKYATREDSIKAYIKNGVLDGDFTTYYKSGSVRDSMIYKSDTLIRKKSWNENGSRLLVPRKILEIDNEWKCYEVAPDSTKIPFSGLTVDSNYVEDNVKYIRLVEYLNGEKNGILERYFLNGKINLKKEYLKGEANGMEIGYYENGKINYSCNYKNNKVEGENIIFYENGAISCKRFWKNGKQDGKYTSFYANGGIKYDANYINGDREGKCVWYDENGGITTERNYHNGYYEMRCECCGKKYWSNEGWSSRPSMFFARGWDEPTTFKEVEGVYCCKKCAYVCCN